MKWFGYGAINVHTGTFLLVKIFKKRKKKVVCRDSHNQEAVFLIYMKEKMGKKK